MAFYNNVIAGAAGAGGDAGYKIERSLRFNRPDTPSLSKTLSAGNQTTWTWSAWVKRADVTTTQSLFSCYAGTDNNDGYVNILFNAQNKLSFSGWSGSYAITNREFRDTSAWYHIVIAVDQTQSNASDRIKIYVNGVAETFGTYSATRSSYPISSAITHNIGSNAYYANTTNKLQGYLAEIHFVDGQQLAATDFGAPDATTGVWNPIEYAGTHGPALNQTRTWSGDATATGHQTTSVSTLFNGILSTNGDHWTATGNGTATLTFSPTLPSGTLVEVWGYRNGNYSNVVKINGTDVSSSIPDSYQNADWNDVSSAASSGISTIEITRGSANPVLSGIRVDGVLLVDSGVTVSSNGFYLDFSDNSSNAALGTDSSGNSNTWTANNLVAADDVSTSAITNVGSTTGTVYYSDNNNNAYDPANLTVFSSGQHSTTASNMRHVKIADLGTGSIALTHVSDNNFYITGSNTTTNTNSSTLVHGTTQPYTINSSFPYAYARIYAGGNGNITYNATVTGPTYPVLTTTNNNNYSSLAVGNSNAAGVSITAINSSGPSITVDGGSWSNGDVFTVFNDSDSVLDSPTNYEADSGNNGGNYAVMNPFTKYAAALANGNLEVTGDRANDWSQTIATIGITSGKFYWEYTIDTVGSTQIGICQHPSNDKIGAGPKGYGYILGNGKIDHNNSDSAYGSSLAAGDVLGIAYDADGGNLYFYKNGTIQNSGTAAATGISSATWFPGISIYGNANPGAGKGHFNFGQRPFAISSIPTGYKSLCTTNLDDPLIADGSDYFDIDTYAGTGSTLERSEFSFSPDFLWIKGRSFTGAHMLFDSVRGATKRLVANQTSNEATVQGVTSFDSDGFTLGNDADCNFNNNTLVAWAWDAGSSNTTISVGSLNSSAYNQDQNWGPGSTVTGSWAFSDTVAAAFDGDLTTKSRAAANQATTIDLPADVAFTSTVKLTGSVDNAGGQIYIKDGTNSFVNVSSGFNQSSTVNTVDITSLLTSPIKEIKLDSVGNGYARMAGIEVDGKLLVSSSATPPSVPSIASTVRANPTAGFSIINHVGTNAAATFGHGLNAAPEFLIFKNRDATDNWFVWSKAADGTATTGGILNSSNAFFTGSANELNSTLPTSSVISVAANLATNGNNQDVITYAFAPVAGYSKFGSYTGNGSADGPFVYTGFKTRWLMIKSSSNSGEDWLILDTARDTYNDGNSSSLYASLSHADNSTTMITTDILSNGFKPRATNAAINASGYTYIYAAFAESPIKYARAR